MLSKAFSVLDSAKRNGIYISINNGELQLKFSKGKHIEPELLQDIRDNKKLITDILKNNQWRSKKIESFENELRQFDRDPIPNIPLSFNQERLWFIDRLEGSIPYHMPAVLRLKGNLNTDALAYALEMIVARHEILRTVIRETGGEGFQYVLDQGRWQLNIVNGFGYKEGSEELKQSVKALINAPFDLSQDHMLRATLINVNHQEHVLVITVHHIASDGWSVSIIVKELAELYASYVQDRSPRLPLLVIQCADYAIWQRNYLKGALLDNIMKYWKDKLHGVEHLDLPFDYPRPAI